MVKRIIFCAIVVAFIVAGAQGGWTQDGKKKLQQRLVERFFRTNVEVLKEGLSLTEQQEVQVQALFDETGKELMALHRAERNGEKVEEELNALQKDKVEKLLVLLTKEQKAELDKLTRHRIKIGREGGGKFFNPEFLNEKLQLTEEQFVKLKEDILKGIHLDIKALRDTYKGDRKRLHEEFQLLLNEITEEIKEVLDERQRELLDKLVKEIRVKGARERVLNPIFLKEKLKLTEEQFARLTQDILKEVKNSIKALRETYKDDRKKLRQEVMKVRKEAIQNVNGILDEDQQKFFDELVNQIRHKKQKSTLPETTSGFLSL